MLYQMHEMQRALMAPLTHFSEVSAKLFTHAASPFAYTPLARQVAASYELIYRLGKSYEKPTWGIPTTEIDGKSVAVDQEVSLALPFCNLLHFTRDLPAKARKADPTILLIAPLLAPTNWTK